MEMLYSDRDIAVCVKPVGLDSEQELPAALKEALGGEIYPIHRLDKNVGGVMVYARTRSAAAELSRLVQEGSLVKEYVALVHGTPPEEGDWEDLLWKDSAKNKVFVVKRQRKGVKPARLEYKRLTAGEAYRTEPPDPGAVCLPGISAGGGSQVRLPGCGRGAHAFLLPRQLPLEGRPPGLCSRPGLGSEGIGKRIEER